MNKTKTLKNTSKYHRIGQKEVPGNLPNFNKGVDMTVERETLQNYLNDQLKKLIELQKKIAFTKPNEASDSEALGLLVSKQCKWQGDDIFNVSYRAFEDSNYHSFNTNFEQLWEKQ